MLEHARHFPGCRRHARDRHDRVAIDFEDLIRAIINHRVARRRAPIARHQHAAGEFEGENGRRLRRGETRRARIAGSRRRQAPLRFSKPCRRKSAGKSDAASPNESLVTGRCAAGSASIGSDPPCASSSTDRACPAWKRQGFGPAPIALLAAPTARAPPVFPSVLACKNATVAAHQNANCRELASVRRRCQACPMIRFRRTLAISFSRRFLAAPGHAQSPLPASETSSEQRPPQL